MSEVDRLSNSGLYPALPIGDKRRSRDQSTDKDPREKPKDEVKPPDDESAGTGKHRIPKSLIDDYA